MENVTTFEKITDVEEFDLDAQLAAFAEEQAEAETEKETETKKKKYSKEEYPFLTDENYKYLMTIDSVLRELGYLSKGVASTANSIISHLTDYKTTKMHQVTNYEMNAEYSAVNWEYSTKKGANGKVKTAVFFPLLVNDGFVLVTKRSPVQVIQFRGVDGLIRVDSPNGGQQHRTLGTTDAEFMKAYSLEGYAQALDYLKHLILTEHVENGVGRKISKIDKTITVGKDQQEQRYYKPVFVIMRELNRSFITHEEEQVIPELRKKLQKMPAADVDKFKINECILYTSKNASKCNNEYDLRQRELIPDPDSEAGKVFHPMFNDKQMNTSRMPYIAPNSVIPTLTDKDRDMVNAVISVFFNEKDAEYFKNVLGAALLNKKQREIQKFTVVHGIPSTGKSSLLYAILNGLFGEYYQKTAGFNRIFSKNNNHGTTALKNGRIRWFDEMEFNDAKNSTTVQDFSGLDVEALKDLVTSGSILINNKFGAIESQTLSTVLIGATNHKPVLNDANGDMDGFPRRLLMLSIRETMMSDKALELAEIVNNYTGSEFVTLPENDFNSFVEEYAEIFAAVFVEAHEADERLLQRAEPYGDELAQLPEIVEELLDVVTAAGVDVTVWKQNIQHVLSGKSSNLSCKIMKNGSLFVGVNPQSVHVKPSDYPKTRAMVKDFLESRNFTKCRQKITIPGRNGETVSGFEIPEQALTTTEG